MKRLILLIVYLTIINVNADENKKQSGISIGSPGGINLVRKGFIGGKPVQFSIGLIGSKLYGFETGYSFYYNESSSFRSSQMVAGLMVSPELSTTERKGSYYPYIGITTTFQRGGFYIEPGISLSHNVTTFIIPNIQIGYLW